MKINKMRFHALMLLICMVGCINGCATETTSKAEINDMVALSVPQGATEVPSDIADTYKDTKAIVTIISDDGVYESCKNLNSIFRERGLKCTVAGAITNIEPYKEDWNELLKDGTIDLVSHSFNHIRMEDGSEIAEDEMALKHEIIDADKWYEDWLGYEHITFVCPENQMCENGYRILDENDFWAVRRGHRGFNSLSPEDGTEYGQWSNLMVQGICDEGVNLAVRNGWVDTAIEDNSWLIEMWHNVMHENDGGYQTILMTDAEEHIDFLAEKAQKGDVWVATFTEAVKYIREKQNAHIVAYIEGNELHIISEFTDENMSYSTFTHPLTIFITLPEKISITDSACTMLNDTKVMLDIVPGEQVTLTIQEEE